jgi:hypothetical protein
MVVHGTPQGTQQPDHQRGAARTVHVVIAIDRHGFAPPHRIGEPAGGDIHIGHGGRIRQQHP